MTHGIPTPLLIAIGIAAVAVGLIVLDLSVLAAVAIGRRLRARRIRQGNRYLQARADRDRLLVVRPRLVARPEQRHIPPAVHGVPAVQPPVDIFDSSSLVDDLHSSLSRKGTV
jgi:hypothetical protein